MYRGHTLSNWFVLIIAGASLAKDAKIVDEWADSLGSELWDLANAVARPDEIKARYKALNARVEDKSGEELVSIISESVGRMLRRKMDAVRCILMVAEDAAEEWNATSAGNFSYVSGKYSLVNNLTSSEIPELMKNDSFIFRNISLTPDSHFYNIPVNTSFSSVHVPTNVYDQLPSVKEAIQWSEALDEIFRQNYRSDPALSWQYFGSSTGILRQYPAMQWKTEKSKDGSDNVDLYDCRIRSWFIEAATCSKDMVVLLDISGSMQGMGYTIAKRTVNSILDTLSNNDFVTLLIYAEETREAVPCFKDMLVQATPENLDTMKESVADISPEGVANLTQAFVKAFSLLEMYREMRGCGPGTPCNQLIMLVTDGVPGNLSEVFNEWNWVENRTHIPVRVFTYLLGREVTMVREIQSMACDNRGYYTHVHDLEEVQEQVLKYIPVIARPLVLQGKEHPVVWTHTYADISNPALATWLWLVMEHEEQKSRLERNLRAKLQGVRINEDDIYVKRGREKDDQETSTGVNVTPWQEYRLLTSVSIPAFDRKSNSDNRTRKANLLGVAGTDVPIKDIEKLTLPYKLGVNGYAFIVSNNGYVILHPDLRPVYDGELKRNYNSIDLTEVEILDDGSGPRQPGPEVLALRRALVDHQAGSMKSILAKLHYDDNRRVTLEKRDYFYAPLPGTPFGLAVTIPNYGTTWIKVGDEIRRNQNVHINVSDFFAGDHWRVHPGWVYCRFHYLEDHEFDTTEEELLYFLAQLGRADWRWADQYEAYPITPDDEEDELDCGRQTLGDDDYYCNKELMQLLVFDAKVTNKSFTEDFVYEDRAASELAERYRVFLRFVATQSGLTRWQLLDPENVPEELNGTKFGELHRRAVNEPWYKGAIFQHNIDPNSISLTVPWAAGVDATVTASQGIFPRDGGKEAPAAVVGFQMPMKALYERFIEITSTSVSPEFNCRSDTFECYLVDQNGYVVICEAHNDIGKFFGILEGTIMNSMVLQGLFKAVELYDYQALCYTYSIVGSADILTNPLDYVRKLLSWLFFRLTWLAAQCVDLPGLLAKVAPEEPKPPPPPPKKIRSSYVCDQRRTLYIMNQSVAESGITNVSSVCSRPFFAERVSHTNLLMVVVDVSYGTCYKRLNVLPTEIHPREYTNSTDDAPCHKIPLNDLPRGPLKGCYTEHPLESEITACGGGSSLRISLLLLIFASLKSLCKSIYDG